MIERVTPEAMLKNALVIVLEGIAIAFLLLVTLFAAMTTAKSPTAVLITYAAAIAVLAWRARHSSSWSAGSGAPLDGVRRLVMRALVVSALGCAAAMVSSVVASRRPSQETLVSRFREHRTEYEGLRDWAIKGSPMPPPECASLGCPTLDHHGSVRFDLAAWGTANNGWRIGLIWSKSTPEPLIPSLDGFQKGSGGRSHWETAFSRIEGDWYLGIVW